jgi:hypothetical protein
MYMAPKSKDGRIRLLEPLATDLAAFRAAIGLGATEIGVIREAVRAYIDGRIAADFDLKSRFEAECERLQAAKRQPIRLVRTETNGEQNK